MAVVIQYIVERQGVAKQTFASKQQADAYDKMLDIAEQFQQWLATTPVGLSEDQLEQLALALAQQKDDIAAICQQKPLKVKKEKQEPTAEPALQLVPVDEAAA